MFEEDNTKIISQNLTHDNHLMKNLWIKRPNKSTSTNLDDYDASFAKGSQDFLFTSKKVYFIELKKGYFSGPYTLLELLIKFLE